ncbi:hypothetical protein C923_04876 [Plasmodium falciparum UGT5.1]|uniref:Uncharacterized protein n=1 Tax=Plasmodium falciparum UGT5.1 TaxID=1237627 RepID=W7J667_PLAFA|nr:hypothetical protein C923_04876 [Plasmodium falciparum UGT5.1]
MKNTVVRIKAELENVKRLFCDDEYLWIFNIRDSTSSLTRDNIQFRKTDILEIPNNFASFECRGIELIDFFPSNNFIVEDTKGKLYYDVNLSDQNWCDYNEEHEMCVGIYNLEYEVN